MGRTEALSESTAPMVSVEVRCLPEVGVTPLDVALAPPTVDGTLAGGGSLTEDGRFVVIAVMFQGDVWPDVPTHSLERPRALGLE